MKIILAKKEHIIKASKILSEEFYDSYKEARKYLIKHITNKECLIAIENKEIMGVLVYLRDYSHYANYCEAIVVGTKFRRKGIAKALFDKYFDICRKETPKKQKYALSSTHTKNLVSIKMHIKLGFKELGRIKSLHYGIDEIFFGYNLLK